MKSKGLLILLGILVLGFVSWFVVALTQAGSQFQSGILTLTSLAICCEIGKALAEAK